MSQWSDVVFTFDLTQHLFKSFVAVSERRQTEKKLTFSHISDIWAIT